MITLDQLLDASRRPAPYEPGEELWNDPHISKMMLEAHLSPDTDAASYKPEKIRAICHYLISALGLQNGASIADLGCGPGLYCALLAQEGFKMTGIERSENSIRYAKEHVPGGNAEFIFDSYLNPFGTGLFDAAMMISQDYGVLSRENRKKLLENIYAALKPDGCFVFDICSMAAYQERAKGSVLKWYDAAPGFWRPHEHFMLEKTIPYPDIPAVCDLFAVIDLEVTPYRIYQTFFSPDTIRAELEENGFRVEAILSNLCGEKYDAASTEIGVICRKI